MILGVYVPILGICVLPQLNNSWCRMELLSLLKSAFHLLVLKDKFLIYNTVVRQVAVLTHESLNILV